MITDWKYVTPPEDIDLTVDLMPERDESDNKLYGIDPAWQREILGTWISLIGDGVAHVDMPPYPDSNYMNQIRSLANHLKTRQDNPASIPYEKLLLTQGMSTTFDAPIGNTDQYKVDFGDVPEDVKSGDPVKRTDVMDMYDWMKKDVRYVRFQGNAQYTMNGYQIDSGVDGEGQLPTPWQRPIIYYWEWYYSNGPNQDEYGYWRKTVANDFTISFTLEGATSECIKNPTFFIRAYGQYNSWDGDSHYGTQELFIPLQNAQMVETDDGLRFTGTVSSNAIRSQFNMTDIPYKDKMKHYSDGSVMGNDGVDIRLYGTSDSPATVCGFMEIKADYRHPEKQ